MSARILTVCTGNICRSPLAEGLLREALDGFPVVVESAGTHAVDGDRATPETVELGRRLGSTDLSEHRARYLTEQLLDGVDLVLTMTRAHSDAVLRLAPSLVKRTFTIREFAYLTSEATIGSLGPGAETPSEDAGGMVAEVARNVHNWRGLVRLSVDDLDVVDPYRRGNAIYEESAAQIGSGIDVIVRLFRTLLLERGRGVH